MKPRLPMAPLTFADFEIRIGLRITYFGFPDADLLCDIGDQQIEDARRDADLMWHAQLFRHRQFPVDRPPLSMFAGGITGEIDCGGAHW